MQIIYDRVKSRFPRKVGMENRLSFIPFTQRLVGGNRLALKLLFGAVGFVLLIAGANFANLLMARASARHREIAVRSAMGASNMQLIRQFLVESVVLSTLGGIAGLLVARVSIAVAKQIGIRAVPRLSDVGIDTRVLLFALAVSFLTGILFGLAPVSTLRGRSVSQNLKEEGGTSSATLGQLRFRRCLVIIEFSLAIVLLTGAGLLLKSLWQMNKLPQGFDPNKVIVIKVSLGGPKYFRHWQEQDAYIQRLSERIGHLPGVEALGVDCGELSQALEMVGTLPYEKDKDSFEVRYISGGFFRALQVPLIRGRWPTAAEWRDLKDLVLVNETFARMYSRGANILGKHIRGGVVDATVVGIVADFKDFQLDAPPEPQVYVAYPLTPGILTMRAYLRTENPKLVGATVSQMTPSIDSDVPFQVETLEQELADSITPRRFNMYIFEAFAGSALALAVIGIYGVLAYLVKQRTREIGIRIALGAQRHAIVSLVLGHGMRIALSGMALGAVIALGLTRLMASMLYETRATDPETLASVVVILILVAVAACCQPAFWAAKTDPVVALRE